MRRIIRHIHHGQLAVSAAALIVTAPVDGQLAATVFGGALILLLFNLIGACRLAELDDTPEHALRTTMREINSHISRTLFAVAAAAFTLGIFLGEPFNTIVLGCAAFLFVFNLANAHRSAQLENERRGG